MQLRFEDERLGRLAYEPDYTPKGWGPDLIRSCRRTINLLHSAHDERDIRNLKGLRLEKLSGRRRGQSSVRINDQTRLVIRFEGKDPTRLIVIIEAVDYH